MRYFFIVVSLVVHVEAIAQSDTELFVPRLEKGHMLFSTTFAIDHREGENETNILQNLDEAYRLKWNITLRGGYFIKDNFALGGLFDFESDLDELNYQDDNGLVDDKRLERSYSIAPFMRNYLPLGSGRFCLYNETNLQFSYGSAVRQVENSLDLTRIESTTYEVRLGIQPGITGFITEGIAVEAGTSLLGLSSEYTESVTNGNEDDKSQSYSNNVNFKIDLLSLFLGVTFYFPTK